VCFQALHSPNVASPSTDNIITFLYDDVANDRSNPFPGKLFNRPTQAGEAGVDVYAGCKKSYTGQDVTPANFLAVLTGSYLTKSVVHWQCDGCSAAQSGGCVVLHWVHRTATAQNQSVTRPLQLCLPTKLNDHRSAGNASAVTGGSGEVLKSGPNSFVFWGFFDHGASGKCTLCL
jgi:hypothetical protein